MGWPNEPHRHALARRGIKTRAILNPIASSELYNPELYLPIKGKDSRSFKGSGLEHMNIYDVIDNVEEFIYEFNGSKEYDEGRLGDYYHMVNDMFRDFNMTFDEFEILYNNDQRLFNIKAIYIFGSRVTGFWTSESDIDIYIELGRTPGIDNHELEYMAEKMSNTIDNYLADEGRNLQVRDDNGMIIQVDIPIISFQSPFDNFDDDNYPALLIWEEGD